MAENPSPSVWLFPPDLVIPYDSSLQSEFYISFEPKHPQRPRGERARFSQVGSISSSCNNFSPGRSLVLWETLGSKGNPMHLPCKPVTTSFCQKTRASLPRKTRFSLVWQAQSVWDWQCSAGSTEQSGIPRAEHTGAAMLLWGCTWEQCCAPCMWHC